MSFNTWSSIALAGVLVAVPVQARMAGPAPAGAPGAAEARVVLHGNVHPAVRDLMPESRCDPAMPMEHMVLALKLRPEARARLEQLLADQQNPGSPRWHRWLTPEQFAASFGPSAGELAQVTSWLGGQGFTVERVARGGTSIHFSGKVETVEQAFRTSMMNYQVNGRTRYANATDPSIPAALAELVDGVVSFHDIPRKAMHTGFRALTPGEQARALGAASPLYTDSLGDHWLSPGDFATIYNVNPLYRADPAINGSGVTIAIVGRTHPANAQANWNQYRSMMGLPANQPNITVASGTGYPAAPGDLGADEDGEANLDVELAGAAAPQATIDFVCAGSQNPEHDPLPTDGSDFSAEYIVDNNLAPIMSSSFDSCEQELGATATGWYGSLWSQAASEGITVFVAAGDSGAAACDDPTSARATGGLAVNGVASSANNVAVGGTLFNDVASPSSYWSDTNSGTGYLSALQYIPEAVWNESGLLTATGDEDLWASGGGASMYNAKPSWQVAPGVPNDGKRDLPDVALSAGGHDGYLVWSVDPASRTGAYALEEVGGTSCASPSFAGLMALVVQHAGGARQGNANGTLYALANAQFLGGAAVFHPVTSGDNSVPGQAGFAANAQGTYNQATGLGSVDADALVTHWGDTLGNSIFVSASSVGLLTGTSASFTAVVTGSADTSVAWSATGGTVTPTSASAATFQAATAGSYTVTAHAAVEESVSTPISVSVHGANLMEAGAPTGLDVLYLLGHDGVADTSLEMAGTGQPVGAADWTALLHLLGWVN